jgi:osomolarity two-component system sensor histidine kinase TcsA
MADICEQIFTLSPIPSIILDPSLCIEKASTSFLQLAKSQPDEYQGRNFIALLTDRVFASGYDVRPVSDVLQKAIHTLEVQTGQNIQTDSLTAWQLRVVPTVLDGMLLYLLVEWLPMMKREQKSDTIGNGVATSEALRLLVEAVNDYAIFLLDTKGNVLTWNIGAQLNKRYLPHEIIGRHFSIFYGEEDLKAGKPEKELEICMRDGKVEDEGWRYRKDGSRFWANVVITTIYDKGVHVGFGKVTRDLTERRAAELRLIAAYEESAKLKSEFLANMSHEIRTPMHGMLSANSLLLDTELAEEQRDLVAIIKDSGQILLQVINDILDYSKLASGSFSLASDVVVIKSILSSVVNSFQTMLKPGVHFQLSSESNIPMSVQGDPLRYRQVLQNLVSNAVKFTDGGLISIHAYIDSEDEHGYVIKTEVQDTGIGIPESAANALFTPFRQFDNSSTKSYQGTGLGLSISKSLVELMGGEIGFTSVSGSSGSLFWFTTNFKKIEVLSDMATLTVQSIETMPITSPLTITTIHKEAFQKKTLLLAEDNIINQKVMIKTLRSLGFERIDIANDGAQAIQLVNGNPKKYDLVLMDISMPIVGGVAATTQIRNAGISVTIIAITANVLKGNREEFLACGMNDYVPKPVDRDFLSKILTKWLCSETLV